MKYSTPRVSILLGYLLLSAMTIVYCVLIWYAGNLFSVLVDKLETGNLPLITLISITLLPLPFLWTMIHWQLAAVLLLIFCISWGFKRSQSQGSDEGHTLPMVTYTTWIVFAICCHLLGAIVPTLMIGHVLI